MSSTSHIEKPKKGKGDGDADPPASKQHEIDAIFDVMKKKRKQGSGKASGILKEEASRDGVEASDDAVTKAKKQKQSKGVRARRGAFVEGAEEPLKPQKKTEEGYRVYRDADLGWNKKDAGGTPLCPFDCNCCF